MTRSWRSPPLAIHHLFQRFPECSPLTTGDFGCTSKAACWEERAGLWRPQVWGRRRPLSRDCPLCSPPAARGHRRPLRDLHRRSSWVLFCLTARVTPVALMSLLLASSWAAAYSGPAEFSPPQGLLLKHHFPILGGPIWSPWGQTFVITGGRRGDSGVCP